MRATSIEHLATMPIRAKQHLKVANGNWTSQDLDDITRYIYHRGTHMVTIYQGCYFQVSEGWGSMTDKCGLAKIRKALGISAKWGITQDLDNTLDRV